MARSSTAAEVIAFPDLGPEAVRRLVVKDMPLFVVNDVHGGDLYQEGKAAYARG
jgi:fumarate hydratase subunit beta